MDNCTLGKQSNKIHIIIHLVTKYIPTNMYSLRIMLYDVHSSSHL